jgi:hypothetical protein
VKYRRIRFGGLIGTTSLLLVFFGTLGMSMSPARGDIIYSGYIGQQLGNDLDFDGDDNDELLFWIDGVISGFNSTYFYAISTSPVANITVDGEHWVQFIAEGSVIGPSISSNSWSPPADPQSPLPEEFLIVAISSGPAVENPQWYGPLIDAGGIAFLPIRWQASDGLHYGWVRLAHDGEPNSSALLMDWAYEACAGVPISATVVPEPSTWVMMISGLFFAACLRRMSKRG